MGTMERIFRLMSEKQASDIFLSAHAPVLIKINGQSVPVNSQILPVEGPRNLLAEVVPPKRMEELEETARLIFTLGNREIRYLTTDEVDELR